MKRILLVLSLAFVVLAMQAGIKTVQYKGLAYAIDTEAHVAYFLRQNVIIKGSLPIPEAIKYKDKASGKYIACPVVSIAEGALAGQKKLKAVYIPASVQEIGDYAFAKCRRLRHAYFESASLGSVASKRNWFAGTKADIHFVLQPGESVNL